MDYNIDLKELSTRESEKVEWKESAICLNFPDAYTSLSIYNGTDRSEPTADLSNWRTLDLYCEILGLKK